MHCAACCIEIGYFVNVAVSTHVTSVLFLVRFNNFAPTTGFDLMELHALTQVARSYALLFMVYCPVLPSIVREVLGMSRKCSTVREVLGMSREHMFGGIVCMVFRSCLWCNG